MSKTIVITGASDGIGAAGARRLHQEGHQVVIVGRSPEKTATVAAELGADHFITDFTSLANVRKLAAALDTAYARIDVLVNNAGGIFGDRDKTVDGFEKTVQINHLAPFLLTNLLMPKLLASKASVIQTSSVGARLFGKLDVDDLDNDTGYTPHRAYGTAKLENILFTKELHNRFSSHGLSAAAFHPGAVATSFASGSKSFMRPIYNNPISRLFLTSPEKEPSRWSGSPRARRAPTGSLVLTTRMASPPVVTIPRRKTRPLPASSGTVLPTSLGQTR